MMHGREKSDLAIVAMKPANKGSRPYGSVRGARDETRVPTATACRVRHAALTARLK
jgi:hypothetical protein